jgi:tetratricopeptide (TPR) repeat protein
MKKVFLIIGLCLAVTAVFAQKAAVTSAERMAKDSRANLNDARNLIKGALENAETKDESKTWFVAGQIEDAQFNRENTKQILGQKPNEPIMYDALSKALPFFIKAQALDQRPDAKGKVSPKFEKNIKGILTANHIYYINGGGYWFGEQDYQKAFDFFEQFLEIANLPFMAGTKAAVRDSNYMIVQYYAAMASTTLNNSELAIKSLKRAKDTPYEQHLIYQWLCGIYAEVEDTDNLEKTLEEGLQVFPDSSYYLFNLINTYISTDRNDKAIDMLNTAISKNPSNPNLYQSLGSVHERGTKDNDKAEENYKKAIELDPENAMNQLNLGRIYYNAGVGKLNEVNLISDANLYNQGRAEVKTLFIKALPFFEKAHQLAPTETDQMIGLRTIYYNLDMGKELEEISTKMEKLYE